MYHPNTNMWDTIDAPYYAFGLTLLTNTAVIVSGLTRDGCLTNKVLVLRRWCPMETIQVFV